MTTCAGGSGSSLSALAHTKPRAVGKTSTAVFGDWPKYGVTELGSLRSNIFFHELMRVLRMIVFRIFVGRIDESVCQIPSRPIALGLFVQLTQQNGQIPLQWIYHEALLHWAENLSNPDLLFELSYSTTPRTTVSATRMQLKSRSHFTN